MSRTAIFALVKELISLKNEEDVSLLNKKSLNVIYSDPILRFSKAKKAIQQNQR